jgi:hypothetical protein
MASQHVFDQFRGVAGKSFDPGGDDSCASASLQLPIPDQLAGLFFHTAGESAHQTPDLLFVHDDCSS